MRADGGRDQHPGRLMVSGSRLSVPGYPAAVGDAAETRHDSRSAEHREPGILESGRALEAAAILLGPWQPGVTCQVAADGMITDVTPPGAGLEGIRLFNLGAAEAAAITAVLRDARGTPTAVPALARPAAARPSQR